LFYIIVFYSFIIVSCFHLSLASWLLFSNEVQFSSVEEFQVGRQPIPSTKCGKGESPVTNLPTRSWYTTKSQLLDERSDDREGMSEAGVNRLAM